MKKHYQVKNNLGLVVTEIESDVTLILEVKPDVVDLTPLRGQHLKDPNSPMGLIGIDEDYNMHPEHKGLRLSREYNWELIKINGSQFVVPKYIK